MESTLWLRGSQFQSSREKTPCTTDRNWYARSCCHEEAEELKTILKVDSSLNKTSIVCQIVQKTQHRRYVNIYGIVVRSRGQKNASRGVLRSHETKSLSLGCTVWTHNCSETVVKAIRTREHRPHPQSPCPSLFFDVNQNAEIDHWDHLPPWGWGSCSSASFQ